MAKVWFEEMAKSAWSAVEALLGDRELDGSNVEVVPAAESVLIVAGGTPTVPDSLFAALARGNGSASAESLPNGPEAKPEPPERLEPMEDLAKESASAKPDSEERDSAAAPEPEAAKPAATKPAADSANPEPSTPADSARP